MKSILNFYEAIDDLPKSPPLPVIPNPNQRIVDAARKASLKPVEQPSFLRDVVKKTYIDPFIVKNAESSNATREQILGYKNKRSFSAPDPGKFRGNSPPIPVGSNNTTSSPDPGKFRDNSSPAPERVNFDRGNAAAPVGNKQFMADKSPSIRQQLSPKIDNNAKLMSAKADATRAAVDYKASHPEPLASAPVAPASKPFSLNNNIDQAIAHRVPPGVASTPVTSVSPIDTANMPSKFDFAAGAGTAVNATKKVGGTLLDKVKEEAPNILNRGAQVMSKLGDVTGYGK
jgi:hypothetical protein